MGNELSPAEKKTLVAAQPAPALKEPKPPCDHSGYTMIHTKSPAKKGDLPTITGRCQMCGATAEQFGLDGAIVTKWSPPPAPASEPA